MNAYLSSTARDVLWCGCNDILCWQLVKLFAIAPFDQILTLDGRQLEGDEKSLAELKLYPDCLLLLKVGYIFYHWLLV